MKSKQISLNPKTMFYIMLSLVIVMSGLVIAGVVFGNGFLQKKSDKLVGLKLQYKIPEESQRALKQAKADIEKYTELKNTAKTIVPQEKDQARTVREIVSLANQTIDPVTKKPIQILSISFPSSTLGNTAPVVAKTPSASGEAATVPTTPVVSTPTVTQVQPVQGIPGVYVLPITIQSDPASAVSFDQIIRFLAKLEQNRRTAQVSQLSISPQKGSEVQLVMAYRS